jgi:molybdenum cofactor cytidylyltransferase
LLNDLVAQQHKTKLPIIVSAYEAYLGTPALFHKSLFPELMKLEGDSGAKKLFSNHKNLLATIPFPKGNIDIDTMEDFIALSGI